MLLLLPLTLKFSCLKKKKTSTEMRQVILKCSAEWHCANQNQSPTGKHKLVHQSLKCIPRCNRSRHSQNLGTGQLSPPSSPHPEHGVGAGGGCVRAEVMGAASRRAARPSGHHAREERRGQEQARECLGLVLSELCLLLCELLWQNSARIPKSTAIAMVCAYHIAQTNSYNAQQCGLKLLPCLTLHRK